MHVSIPLTMLKPMRAEEQPLIDKIAVQIPTWKAGLLNWMCYLDEGHSISHPNSRLHHIRSVELGFATN